MSTSRRGGFAASSADGKSKNTPPSRRGRRALYTAGTTTPPVVAPQNGPLPSIPPNAATPVFNRSRVISQAEAPSVNRTLRFEDDEEEDLEPANLPFNTAASAVAVLVGTAPEPTDPPPPPRKKTRWSVPLELTPVPNEPLRRVQAATTSMLARTSKRSQPQSENVDRTSLECSTLDEQNQRISTNLAQIRYNQREMSIVYEGLQTAADKFRQKIETVLSDARVVGYDYVPKADVLDLHQATVRRIAIIMRPHPVGTNF